MPRKKKNTLSLKATATLIILIFILGFGVTMWYYALYKVVHVETQSIEIKIVDGKKHIGFNADPSLHFGKIPSVGGTVIKNIYLTNDEDIPVLINIQAKGEATQFFQLEDNNFVLEPGESRNLKAYATIPEGYGKTGIYTGTAKITFMRT
ncbi:hypothetical protein ACFL3V_04580 [Nanoarchaeota archaeon]